MKKFKPTKKQFKKIKKRFLKETHIKIIRSDKWYTRILRIALVRSAERQLEDAGIKNAKAFLNERFFVFDANGQTFLFAPRALDHRKPIRNLCLLTHERHHVDQKDEDIHAYYKKYATPEGRSNIEADAYASEEPVRAFFGYSMAERRFNENWGKIYYLDDVNREKANMRYVAMIDSGFCPHAASLMLSICRKVIS